MDQQHDFELKIISKTRFLCVARAMIGAAVERLGFDEAACGQIMLAIDEALTNIIRHGYDGDESRPIWICFDEHGQGDQPGFRIVIEDEARQVDPESIRGRELEEVRPGGLGVHIIRQVMDEVNYSKRPGGGMRLEMIKIFNPADDGQTPQISKEGN